MGQEGNGYVMFEMVIGPCIWQRRHQSLMLISAVCFLHVGAQGKGNDIEFPPFLGKHQCISGR